MQQINIWALIITVLVLIIYIILMISMFKSNKIKLDSMFAGKIEKVPPRKNILYRVEKRVIDIIFSLLVLITMSPMVIVFAILIKLEDHGPITYKMYCVGEYGRISSYQLFRTMKQCDSDYTKNYSQAKTTKDVDPRLTNIGYILRKTGLDYIPMFLSVLKGDLTIIGLSRKNPRTITSTHKELFKYGKPGILSLSMISKPDKQPIDQETADRIYLQSIRLFTDMEIMLYAINNTYVSMTRNIDTQTDRNPQQTLEIVSKEKTTLDADYNNSIWSSETTTVSPSDSSTKKANSETDTRFKKTPREKDIVIRLQKGQKVNLTNNVKIALVGLGWDTSKYSGIADFDLDVSAFLLGANGKVRKDSDFLFYNNLQSDNGAVVHTGDCLTGGPGGDDETIFIDFSKVPQDVQKIAITVTIYEAQERGQNFSQVSNAYVHVVKCTSESDKVGKEELRYDLGEEFSIETALVVCEIYRSGDEWTFNAVGTGYQGGLYELCKNYGVNV